MKYLDLTRPTPAENLAGDEALLDWCEAGHCDDELLRVWEPAGYFVVVGYANKVATEVNTFACEAKGVPIYRRCTGGGAVLQGPGCLNYALILKITATGPLHSISTANRFIMERNRAALETVLVPSRRREEAPSPKPAIHNPQSAITVRGHTDLALGALKFSGNSQRRRRRFLLFHGTFLLNLNLTRLDALLPMPSKQPAYRENRAHADFLTNLNLPANEVKAALRKAWNATSPPKNPPGEEITDLAREKYGTCEWNFRF